MNSHLNLVIDNSYIEKATKILSKNLYRELKSSGFSDKDIVNFSIALVENVVNSTTSARTQPTAFACNHK